MTFEQNLLKELIYKGLKNNIKNNNKLPDSKVKEVSDYADFLISKIEDKILTDRIKKIVSNSKSFDFLNDEEDLYTIKDVKEKYN